MTLGDIAILEAGLEQAAEAAEGVAQEPERVSVPSADPMHAVPPTAPGRPLSLHEERQLEIQKYEQQQLSQAGAQTSADRLRSMGITVNSDR